MSPDDCWGICQADLTKGSWQERDQPQGTPVSHSLGCWGAGPRPGRPPARVPLKRSAQGSVGSRETWCQLEAKNREWAGEGQRWPHPATEEQPVRPTFLTHFSPCFFWIQYRRMDVLTLHPAGEKGTGKLYSSSLCLLNDLPCALFKWVFKGVNCKVIGVHNFVYLFILQ